MVPGAQWVSATLVTASWLSSWACSWQQGIRREGTLTLALPRPSKLEAVFGLYTVRGVKGLNIPSMTHLIKPMEPSSFIRSCGPCLNTPGNASLLRYPFSWTPGQTVFARTIMIWSVHSTTPQSHWCLTDPRWALTGLPCRLQSPGSCQYLSNDGLRCSEPVCLLEYFHTFLTQAIPWAAVGFFVHIPASLPHPPPVTSPLPRVQQSRSRGRLLAPLITLT